MEDKKNLESVRDEQFTSPDTGNENTNKEKEHTPTPNQEHVDENNTTADQLKDSTEDRIKPEEKGSEKEDGGVSSKDSDEKPEPVSATDKDTKEVIEGDTAKSEQDVSAEKKESESKEQKQEKTDESEEVKASAADTSSDSKSENKEETEEHPKKEESQPEDKAENKEGESEKDSKLQEPTQSVREKPDYSKLGKDDLIKEFVLLLENENVFESKDDVEIIRTSFEKIRNDEKRQLKKKFIEEGGKPEDFKAPEDPQEYRLKDLLQAYREKKNDFFKKQEKEKAGNLEEKYKIIEEIKDLINRKESLNKTFNEFNDLQRRWREIGLVPQANVKELWETYHHHVEKFYDYIKINKELRDLDFKKNLEAKTVLCEKAEELLLEPNIIEAFRTLQTYHDQWREIGPVPPDMRSEIWERFKEATAKINKKHQEYFENLKDQQKNNLEQKEILCEKAEEITALEITSFKEWDKKAQELKELQRVWKTIGFAPRKDNNAIYARFRLACDTFFTRKREFFSHQREEQQNNLQLKTDLCIQAESVKDSTDWKKTTDELIQLQKRWKEIGPVPRKHSDTVWKRFRAACDDFFNRKEDHFSNIDSKYGENLKKKESLIEKIKNYTISEDAQESLDKLKEFQREWAEIGYVPIKDKDRIQQEYRNAINDKFDHLKLDERKKNIIKYKSKLEDLTHKSKATVRMRQDREKFISKLKQLENDIVLWENNIGFFSNSKNAEKMIQEVENKIKNAHKSIELLKQKIVLLEEKLDDYE